MKGSNQCRAWADGDPLLEEYLDHEWCKASYDDRFRYSSQASQGNTSAGRF